MPETQGSENLPSSPNEVISPSLHTWEDLDLQLRTQNKVKRYVREFVINFKGAQSVGKFVSKVMALYPEELTSPALTVVEDKSLEKFQKLDKELNDRKPEEARESRFLNSLFIKEILMSSSSISDSELARRFRLFSRRLFLTAVKRSEEINGVKIDPDLVKRISQKLMNPTVTLDRDLDLDLMEFSHSQNAEITDNASKISTNHKPENSEQPITQEPPSKMGRRMAIGKTVKAGLGLAAGAFLAQETMQTFEGKVETSSGIFYPLYEFHTAPIEKLPDKCDIYWMENRDFSREGLRKELYEKGARVAFGDVDYRPQDLSKDEVKAASAIIASSIMAIAPATAGLAIGTLLEKPSLSRKINRRVVLGGLAATAFSATTLNFLAEESNAVSGTEIPHVPYGLDTNNPAKDASGRMIIRLRGLLSDLHPEIAVIFFRNAVWAHKLLEYSKKLQGELGRKPSFALAVGAGHSGVEDFLLLGEKFVETCISAYPKEWLSEVVKTNGGIEKFSSIRTTQPTHSPSEVPNVKDSDIFVDQELANTLNKVLPKNA